MCTFNKLNINSAKFLPFANFYLIKLYQLSNMNDNNLVIKQFANLCTK